MRLYDRYLGTLAVLFTATSLVLAVYRPYEITLYLSLYLIEYMGTTLFFAHLHPRARRLLNRMGYILFAGFLIMFAVKMVTTILGTELILQLEPYRSATMDGIPLFKSEQG